MDRASEFVAEWERITPHQMSPRMRAAYSHTLNWLTENPRAAGLKDKGPKPDLDDGSEYGIAKHYYWYFETHFFKSQNSLIKASSLANSHHNANWLDQPILWVLDIGCGTGAATCAILDLMCDYQQYRWDHGFPVAPKKIHLIAVDPCSFALEVYSKMMDELRPSLIQQHISVNVQYIRDEFPLDPCLERIVVEWAQDNLTTLLTLASNVVRPLQNKWDKWKTLFKLGGNSLNLELGDVLAKAYEYLLDRLAYRQIILVDIVTHQRTTKGEWLFDILKKIAKAFIDKFSQKPTMEWWSIQKDQSITFLNSPNTFHADQGKSGDVTSKYSHSITIGAKCPNKDDSCWNEIRTEKNLKLAQARTRNYIYYNDFVDEVEIKLADYFWPDYVNRLALFLDAVEYSALGVHSNIYYAFPKKKDEDRPRYYLHLEEQLIAAAISQTQASCFKPYKEDCILGDRLNEKSTEFFYERWNRHFKNYKNAIRSVARGKLQVAKVDIRSFYTRIRQNNLYQLLRTSVGVDNSSTVAALLREIILRNLIIPPHEPNIGLPQSGITAGLWSSKYLKSVDQDIISKFGGGKYFRYADDITIVDEVSANNEHIKTLNDSLNRLGLELNPDKERRYDADHYKRLTADDRRFREITRALRKILEGLYFLPSGYLYEWGANRDSFLEMYSKLLRGVGIHLPPLWLNRQLKTRDTLGLKFGHFFSDQRVHFPPLSLSAGEWADQFLHKNTDWIKVRDDVIIQLVEFFHDQYNKYLSSTSDDETKRAARSALRFSVYRLSVFDVSPIADDLVSIIADKPDLLITSITLKALADSSRIDDLMGLALRWHNREIPENKLGNVMDSGKYLCAKACWAIGQAEPTEQIIEFLFGVLFSPESDIVEQLMSSEALIRLRVPIDNHLEELKHLMGRCQDLPYLIKNLILLAASGNIPFQEILPTLPIQVEDTIVRDAVQFALIDKRNILSIPEPREIEHYYAERYPDLPFELHRKDSSSGS